MGGVDTVSDQGKPWREKERVVQGTVALHEVMHSPMQVRWTELSGRMNEAKIEQPFEFVALIIFWQDELPEGEVMGSS